jgi:tetratricopeptide (TPR) repeat protein
MSLSRIPMLALLALAVLGQPEAEKAEFERKDAELVKQMIVHSKQRQADQTSAKAALLFAHTAHALYRHRYTKFPDKQIMTEAIDAYYDFVRHPGAVGYEELHIVHSNMGSGLNALGRFEESIHSQKTALKLRPDFESAEWHRGTSLAHMGDISGAISAFKSALAINPTYAEAFASLGSVKRFEAGDDEIKMMEAALPQLQGEEQWQQRMVSASRRSVDGAATDSSCDFVVYTFHAG